MGGQIRLRRLYLARASGRTAARAWSRTTARDFATIEENCWDPHTADRGMDAAGVNVQVLSTVPVMFSYWAKPHGRRRDREISQRRYRGRRKRISACDSSASAPCRCRTPNLRSDELERCKSIGLAGVEIGTNVNQLNLSEPRFFDFFAACEELGMAVFVHPWDMMGEKDMQKYWLPWLVGMPAEVSRAICSLIFGGVLERLPQLADNVSPTAAEHFPRRSAGSSMASRCGPISVRSTIRTARASILSRMYFDSLVHDPAAARFLD